jgi:TldD protein
MAMAVSASPTISLALPWRPGPMGTPVRYAAVLDHDLIRRTLDTALRTGGELAEVFVEDRSSSNAVFDDGKVENVSSGRERGAGIRVIVGDTTGFAHTADLTEAGLTAAAEAAAAAARGGGGGVREVALTRLDVPRPNEVAVLPEDVAKARKVELLAKADDAARAAGSAITQVTARYGDSRRRILVANSDGLLTEDDQVRTLFSVLAVASGDTGMQTGYQTLGRTVGFELFDTYDVAELGREAARRALLKLTARPAPSGTVPVVIGPGGGGVLFHEACGHGLEADLVAKGASVFAGRIGERVADPRITLVDDGTMGEEWGCFAVDDEGSPASRNVLIEDGILTDYMWDLLRSRKEGRPRSGNGRRQSYKHLPMVRMTNTYVLAGPDSPEDIVASTPSGVYVAHLGGGQVNTATGDFVFGMTEAYMIEDGKITEPIREGNLIGNGPEVLATIDAVGHDFAMGSPGTCGKDGQGVPVGDGVPTLRVPALTVGGTA